jgi:hypothetical protein
MSTAKLKRGDSDLVSFGQMGGALCSSSTAVDVPEGLSVVAITSLASNTNVPNGATGFPQTSGNLIPAGVTIYGRWDRNSEGKFALAAGLAVVYFG